MSDYSLKWPLTYVYVPAEDFFALECCPEERNSVILHTCLPRQYHLKFPSTMIMCSICARIFLTTFFSFLPFRSCSMEYCIHLCSDRGIRPCQKRIWQTPKAFISVEWHQQKPFRKEQSFPVQPATVWIQMGHSRQEAQRLCGRVGG